VSLSLSFSPDSNALAAASVGKASYGQAIYLWGNRSRAGGCQATGGDDLGRRRTKPPGS